MTIPSFDTEYPRVDEILRGLEARPAADHNQTFDRDLTNFRVRLIALARFAALQSDYDRYEPLQERFAHLVNMRNDERRAERWRLGCCACGIAAAIFCCATGGDPRPAAKAARARAGRAAKFLCAHANDPGVRRAVEIAALCVKRA